MESGKIKRSLKSLWRGMAETRLLDWVPDRFYLKLLYREKMGRRLNLKAPKAFTEKIQWLKLYDRNPLNTVISDKYAVREYIADRIGSGYTVPLLGVWNSFDEIDFEELPDQFILKTTHDSGGNYICTDKSKLDLNEAKAKIERHLKRNYYPYYREWAYKDIQPRVIAEEFLVDESGYELKDYKFLCMNGRPKYVAVCSDRDGGHAKVDVFDTQWESWADKIIYRDYPPCTCSLKRPENYDVMVKLCAVLAEPFPFVRVDMYNIRGEIYVGELTLYPGAGYAGYQTFEIDETVGSWLTLPDRK